MGQLSIVQELLKHWKLLTDNPLPFVLVFVFGLLLAALWSKRAVALAKQEAELARREGIFANSRADHYKERYEESQGFRVHDPPPKESPPKDG